MKMEIDITCILVAICNCAIAKNTKLSTVLKSEKFRKSKMNYVAREQIIMLFTKECYNELNIHSLKISTA